jgi:hypothetical protein
VAIAAVDVPLKLPLDAAFLIRRTSRTRCWTRRVVVDFALKHAACRVMTASAPPRENGVNAPARRREEGEAAGPARASSQS